MNCDVNINYIDQYEILDGKTYMIFSFFDHGNLARALEFDNLQIDL